MKALFILMFFVFMGYAQQSQFDKISFHPISHATFVISLDTLTIYVDPVGGAEEFKGQKSPDIILITDIHGDHMNKETLSAVLTKKTKIIAPKAVVESIEMGEVLINGMTTKVQGVSIKAIPMYNLTEERLKNHPKGRGNGYLITALGKNIYISGDTEDIPEMRQLKNIDYAFVCMNLPYTMSVDQAASAVLEMKPKYVFPYHYRGSDVDKFKELVAVDKAITVELLKWY
jgi:L-ascorbate metabolism protein UlaG (beta-lactamase superfamily)